MIQESILMNSFQKSVRKRNTEKKLYYLMLSITILGRHNFGAKWEMKYEGLINKKGSLKKKKNHTDHLSLIPGVQGRKKWNSCTYRWCIGKDRISCSGGTLKSHTSAVEQTRWSTGHRRAPKLHTGQVCDPEVGNETEQNPTLDLPRTGLKGSVGNVESM